MEVPDGVQEVNVKIENPSTELPHVLDVKGHFSKTKEKEN